MPPRIALSRHYIVDPSGCWLWTGCINPDGYGVFRNTSAHRLTYQESRGPIPAGLVLDHRCKNRRCVNPDHLEAVTQRENRRRSATLSASVVSEIRSLAGVLSQRELASNYGVSQSCISRVLNHARWRN